MPSGAMSGATGHAPGLMAIVQEVSRALWPQGREVVKTPQPLQKDSETNILNSGLSVELDLPLPGTWLPASIRQHRMSPDREP